MSAANQKDFNQLRLWVQNILNGFQQNLVSTQREFQLRWNALQTVIHVLVRKGIVTEQDIKESAEILLAEAKADDEKLKAMTRDGQKVTQDDLTKKPIDKIVDSMADVYRGTKKEQTNGDHAE